jgi:asparagine synthase (glutamine-hydrolysing)
MSAVFGILNLDGAAVAAADIERMATALAHRAPDRSATWLDGRIALGHGLMRITEEDRYEVQPLHDASAAMTLVADLRLDNRDALGAAFGLGSRDLRDLPDSALLLRAYQKWGEECVRHLLGDFVFALWDARQRKLVIGRDHLGQRSCYFHRGERTFAFASEIKALWTQPQVPRVLTEAGIARMLMHDMAPRRGATNYAGIEALTGGAIMIIDASGATAHRDYWEPRADPAHQGRDEAYYIEAYRSVLGEAVACRLRRTLAPAALLMSGGYDSSAIAALAGPVCIAQNRKLVAVCSAMPADYRGTIRHARQWVEMCRRDMAHLDVRYVTRDGRGLFSDLELNFSQDGGGGAYHFVNRALYAAAAAAGARVILDGYGGDQTLNPRGSAALARLLARGRLARFLHEFRCHRRMTENSIWQTMKGDVLALLLPALAQAWRRLKHGADPPWHDQPVNADFARRMIADGAIEIGRLRTAARRRIDVEAGMQRALARHAAAAKSTAAAAVHGLEPTQPFFDKRVVELALAIPPDLHVKNGRNRYLACRALADLYPPEFQTRGRRNDDLIPDFQRMVKTAEPEILAELARMERSGALKRYVDFAKIRQLLATRGADDHNSGWEEETQVAVAGFMTARFIEWFRGYN